MTDISDILFPKRKSRNGPIPAPLADRFWPKVIVREEGCWGWNASKHKHGYGKLGVGGYDGGWMCAHIASWLLHFGAIPEGLFVCHKCDNPECCRPDHLFLGTAQENSLDSVQKGRWAVNPPVFGLRLFTENQIRSIRSRVMSGESYTSIAKSLKVSEPTIQKIGKRITYVEVV